jgi:hypothetical protein
LEAQTDCGNKLSASLNFFDAYKLSPSLRASTASLYASIISILIPLSDEGRDAISCFSLPEQENKKIALKNDINIFFNIKLKITLSKFNFITN